jgi:protein tyrosine/serine phosphatase
MKIRVILAVLLGAAILGVPTVYYRMVYEGEKRFREVTPGRFYRCGQMTADGFRSKLREHKIKLVINLQDEFPNPMLSSGYWDSPHIEESKVCEEEGARYVMITWAGEKGLLARNEATPDHRPEVIDRFLELCDDQKNSPILIHCLAGLHRTGILTAVYRMEYEGWTPAEAMRELRANGYGDRKATTANDYILEYLYQYKPRARSK